MAKYYHTKIPPVTTAATSSASGYPSSNVALESISRPWRSTSTAGQNVDQFWTTPTTVAAVLLEDVNFTQCNVARSTDGASFVSPVIVPTYADKLTGRRRALLALNVASLRGIRVGIDAGTPADGLAYWRIGSVYIFNLSVSLPVMAQHGKLRMAGIFANATTELPNMQVAQATLGPDAIRLTLGFNRKYDQDVHDLQRRSRVATVGLDFELPVEYPDMTLPVRHYQDSVEESVNFLQRAETTIELRERV